MSSGPRRRPDESIVEAALKVGAGGLTVKDLEQAQAFAHFKPGAVVTLRRDRATQYVIENVHGTASGVPQATIRRLVPKLSKAQKKAAKRAQRGKARGLL